MSVLTKTAKVGVGAKAAKEVGPDVLRVGTRIAKPAGRVGIKAGRPLLKRRTRKQAARLGDAARSFAEAVAIYAPQAAQELGIVEPPKPKRTAPRVLAGVAVGATAVYLLEPGAGAERRQKLLSLVA